MRPRDRRRAEGSGARAPNFTPWTTVPFVKEDGAWKIDKQGYANQMLQQMDQNNQRLDQMINGGATPAPTAY